MIFVSIRQESMIIKNPAKSRVHWFLDEGGVSLFLLRKEALPRFE